MSKFKKIGVILILVGIGLPLVIFFWAGIDRWTVPPNFKEISIPIFINMTDVILRESDIVLRKDKIEEVFHYRMAREDGYTDREIVEYLVKKQSLNQGGWKIVREEPIEQFSDQNKMEKSRNQDKWKIVREEPIEQFSDQNKKEPINWADYLEEIKEISIPYRYIFLLGSILVLTGVGLVVLSNNKKKDQTNEIHNS